MHVLIVDDNRGLAENLAEILAEEGYECAVVHDAEAAIHRLARAPYDLVITDLCMGPQSGFAVVEAARRRQVSTPVMLMTALPEAVRLGREHASVVEVFAKPLDTGRFVQVVNSCLGRDKRPTDKRPSPMARSRTTWSGVRYGDHPRYAHSD